MGTPSFKFVHAQRDRIQAIRKEIQLFLLELDDQKNRAQRIDQMCAEALHPERFKIKNPAAGCGERGGLTSPSPTASPPDEAQISTIVIKNPWDDMTFDDWKTVEIQKLPEWAAYLTTRGIKPSAGFWIQINTERAIRQIPPSIIRAVYVTLGREL